MRKAKLNVPLDPRISIVVGCDDESLLLTSVLPSLSSDFQRDIGALDYEVVVVFSRDRVPKEPLPSLGIDVKVATLEDGTDWIAAGAQASRGRFIAFFGEPGAASATLVSCIDAALALHPTAAIVIPTFKLERGVGEGLEAWLDRYDLPAAGHGLLHDATVSWAESPRFRWLDPIDGPTNVAVSRGIAERVDPGSSTELWRLAEKRVQIVGDALIRPSAEGAPPIGAPRDGERVDPGLEFFGRVHRPERWSLPLPAISSVRQRPRLSVIVVVYNMARELPRTLASLEYQRGIGRDDYEIIVVDNGSREPLSEAGLRRTSPDVTYHYLENAPPSPARAINYGVSRASGDALAIMIDGACLLSPGVLAAGLAAWRVFPCPLVVTRYFYLGPGDQLDTVHEGYDQAAEDRLLESIDWPKDGYRLFEISSPLTLGGPRTHWLAGWFESNCLLLPRLLFDAIGGCDERFDFPGGGYLNVDLLFRCCDLASVQPVQLLGEGVFHQVHGGITTNTSRSFLEARDAEYLEQYTALRGAWPDNHPQNFYFHGRLPMTAARRKIYG